LPAGFSVGEKQADYVLELKKFLYGLWQAGLNWFETLRDHLLSAGFRQSMQDPCCFMRDNLVLLCYVDDLLILCKDEARIEQVVQELKQRFILEDQGDVASYLGISISPFFSDGKQMFKLLQPHLIQHIINSVGLKDSRLHDTPAEPGKPLTKDADGTHRVYDWSFSSIVGMLNYLCRTRPDMLYAVHQCARFCTFPKLSHEKAIKRIIRYLKQTPDEGIIFVPDTMLCRC